jgi:hypothetical protein
MRRLATVSTGWKSASSEKPATALPTIRPAVLPPVRSLLPPPPIAPEILRWLQGGCELSFKTDEAAGSQSRV